MHRRSSRPPEAIGWVARLDVNPDADTDQADVLRQHRRDRAVMAVVFLLLFAFSYSEQVVSGAFPVIAGGGRPLGGCGDRRRCRGIGFGMMKRVIARADGDSSRLWGWWWTGVNVLLACEHSTPKPRSWSPKWMSPNRWRSCSPSRGFSPDWLLGVAAGIHYARRGSQVAARYQLKMTPVRSSDTFHMRAAFSPLRKGAQRFCSPGGPPARPGHRGP